MKDKLSAKQRETLKVLRRTMERTGMTPTQRDLMKLLGVTQNAVRCRLAALHRKGFIIVVPRIARGIVLLEDKKSA